MARPCSSRKGDLEDRMETLSEELGFSLWLDPDGASALHSAKTVEQLVLALAHFMDQPGAKSIPIGSSEC